jgi:heat shock protein HslJ
MSIRRSIVVPILFPPAEAPGAAGAPAGPPLGGVEWRLESVADRTISPPADQVPTMRFDAEGKMSGFAGCNRMFGSYEMEGSTLRFGGVGATRMMCPDRMDIENAFLAAIHATRSFSMKEGALALADSAGAVVAVLRPGASAAPE